MIKIRKEVLRKGSFTVEASVLIPLLVIIIFCFLSLTLYLHDISVMSACASEIAGKAAAEKYETTAHLESRLAGESESLIEGRLFLFGDNIEAAVEVSDSEITVTYSGSSALMWGLCAVESESAVRQNPVDGIRSTMKLENLTEAVAEELADLLE